MMIKDPAVSNCPPADRLAGLLTDAIDGEDRTILEDHLEKCPHCVGVLQELAGDSAEWVEFEKCLRESSRCWDQTRDLGRLANAIDLPPDVPGYQILGEVGRGGMGIVYRARQVSLERFVALKVMRAARETNPEHRRRFQREAEIIARLKHPNIVQIHDFNDLPEGMYLALEFIERGNLSTRLKENTLGASEAAQLIQILARAIHAAHQAGILHRDLKPANVLLGAPPDAESQQDQDAVVTTGQDRYVPKLTDFGLARRLDQPSDTRTGAVMGTPSYMPPEQVRGGEGWNTPAVDVYGLGAVLYESLTGRPPFRAESSYHTLRMVVQDDPVPPSRLVPHVPRDLETICMKCLRKAPTERYPSAAALADDLKRFLAGQPVEARPVSWWVHGWHWVRRRPVLAVGLMITGIALLILLFVWADFTRQLQAMTIDLRTQTELAQAAQADAEAGQDQANKALERLALQRRSEEVKLLQAENLLRRQVTTVLDDPALRKPEMLPTRQRLVRDALRQYARILGLFPNHGQLSWNRAQGYHWVGRMALVWDTPVESAYYLHRATEVGEAIAMEGTAPENYEEDLAQAFVSLGKVQLILDKPPAVEKSYRRALVLIRDQRKGAPKDPKLIGFEAYTLAQLADVIVRDEPARAGEARKLLGEARDLLNGADPKDPGSWVTQGTIDLTAARLVALKGNAEAVRKAYSEVIARCEDKTAKLQESHAKFRLLAQAHEQLGQWERDAGNVAATITQHQKASAAREALVKAVPNAHRFRDEWGRTLRTLAEAQLNQQKAMEAAESYRRAIAVQQDLIAQMPDIWKYVLDHGRTVIALGEIANNAEDYPKIVEAAIAVIRPWAQNSDTQDDAKQLIEALHATQPKP